VKTGIQSLNINFPGFLLEFIPMKIGAGMTTPKDSRIIKIASENPFLWTGFFT
jgi:hypothetical protein